MSSCLSQIVCNYELTNGLRNHLCTLAVENSCGTFSFSGASVLFRFFKITFFFRLAEEAGYNLENIIFNQISMKNINNKAKPVAHKYQLWTVVFMQLYLFWQLDK